MGLSFPRRCGTLEEEQQGEKGCDISSSLSSSHLLQLWWVQLFKIPGRGIPVPALQSLPTPDHTALSICRPQAYAHLVFLFIAAQLRSHCNGENKLELNETEIQSPGSMTADEHYWLFYVSTAWGGRGGAPTSVTGNLANRYMEVWRGVPLAARVSVFKLCPPLRKKSRTYGIFANR